MSERQVKDFKALSYFIDYSPMALILNDECSEDDSDRMRSDASSTVEGLTPYSSNSNSKKDTETIVYPAQKESKMPKAVMEDNDDVLSSSRKASIATSKSRKGKTHNMLDDYGRGDKACECNIF